MLRTAALLFFFLLLAGGCTTNVKEANGTNQQMNTGRDINAVKEAHTKELMSIRGVVGVYVGEMEDGKACIAVMVDTLTPARQKMIPSVLEGFPVRVEESGIIRPMK